MSPHFEKETFFFTIMNFVLLKDIFRQAFACLHVVHRNVLWSETVVSIFLFMIQLTLHKPNKCKGPVNIIPMMMMTPMIIYMLGSQPSLHLTK